MPNTKELMGASTALLVLSVLSRGPSYGYEIVKTVNEEADGLLTWQEGTLYPILHKLEADALIRAQWQDAPTGRQRKYYYLTAKGRTSLRQDAQQFADVSQLVLRMTGAAHG